EVLVELEVEPDGDPLRVGPAALLRALDEQLVRPELLPGRPDAPLPQLLELVRLERRPHLAEPRPELRAEHGEVRLVGEADGRAVEEHDLLHAQLLLDLLEVRARGGRSEDGRAAQRLPEL